MNVRIALFFVATYAWSWAFWGLAAFGGLNVNSGTGAALLILGLAGPAVAGIGYIYSSRDRSVIADYWLRVVDFARIGWPSLVLICLLFPALVAVAVVLHDLFSGADSTAAIGERILHLFPDPAIATATLCAVLIRGPLPEELGWRGAILDDLQRKQGWVAASVALGIAWAFWHLPLFLMQGMVHHEYGLASAWCWQFLVMVVCMSVVFSWIYNRTRRSTLAIILAHFMANIAMMIGNVSAGINVFVLVVWIVVAVAIVCFGNQYVQPPARRGA